MANTKQLAKEKEMAMSVSNVYLHVVEDVINNVRADFQSEGVDDNVLNELQSVRDLFPSYFDCLVSVVLILIGY